MSKEEVNILSIESSCDDTSASVSKNHKCISNVVASQLVHEEYGGVVPELASRAHIQNIIPVVQKALDEAKIKLNDLNAIAYTRGPGLLGSLMVGVSFAKSLAMSLNIPLIDVNHLEAHVFSCMIDDNIGDDINVPQFPFICLTVSGGHTQILKVNDFDDIIIIGQTHDDAVGEIYDKIARYLNLSYPGGPIIDKLAQNGNPDFITFSKPKVNDYNFSFSGLKTQVINYISNQKQKDELFIDKHLNDICASFQQTVVNILISKLNNYYKNTYINNITISGGVAANSELRKKILEFGQINNVNIFLPKKKYCTDNAAMIGVVAYSKYLNKNFSDFNKTAFSRITNNDKLN